MSLRITDVARIIIDVWAGPPPNDMCFSLPPFICGEKDIYRKERVEDDEIDRWIATVKLDQIPYYRVQRFFGRVSHLYVFASPPKMGVVKVAT